MSVLRPKRIDIGLAVAVIALVLFGIVMIYSASIIVGYTQFNDPQIFFRKQIFSAIIGVVAMITTSFIDYQHWKKWAGWMFGITVFLLISVFFFSKGEINGAHRWITFAGQSFQPSELAKLSFIMYLAAWLSERKDKMHEVVGTFLPFVLVLVFVCALILRQPDFGTMIIFFVTAVAIYIVAGMTLPQVILGGGFGALALMAILAEPYRRDRITTFLDPTKETSGISWHATNIAIAIGSGGWFGTGFGNSAQKRLFLPEPHTDSIFAVIAEELGLVVATALILAFVFVIWRGYRIALGTQDVFGRLLAVGITSWFAFQAFLNLASMAHIVPLVGVPLPFISYGGSNLIFSMAAAGVLLNISRQVDHTAAPEVATPRRKKK